MTGKIEKVFIRSVFRKILKRLNRISREIFVVYISTIKRQILEVSYKRNIVWHEYGGQK